MAEKSKNALVALTDEKRGSLWNLRASYLPNINQEVYFKRALLTVLDNKDLAAMAKSDSGALSILKCLGKALQMGLQIGGTIPQAYIVPFKDKSGTLNAVLIVTAEGYQFISTMDPDPVLRSFAARPVYDGEDFALDYGSGTVKHTYDGKTRRGKLIGVYCQIERIRDAYSRSFAAYGKGPWKDEFDAMCKKTAAKKFLKPYAAMKEGLAMALAVDDGDSARDARPISDRVGDRLDDIIDAELVSGPEPEKAPAPENPPVGSAGGKKSIF